MSRTHNTSIAKSRLGPPRFGRRENDQPGPVKTYRLGPEELARYGPVTPPEKAERIRMKHRGLLNYHKTRPKEGENVAMEVYQPAGRVPAEAPAAEKPKTALDRLREALTKEKYLQLKAEGRSDKQIIKDMRTFPIAFYRLKDEWGLVSKPAPPEKPAREVPDRPPEVPALEEALSGVACPVPGEDFSFRLAELEKIVVQQAEYISELRQLIIALEDLVNEINERLQELENDYRRHRHQVGPGHWSGKAET